MLFLWVPMCLLYEVGILLCVYQKPRRGHDDWEMEESQEMVEV